MTREELRDYVEEQRNLDIIPYHVYSTLIDGIDTLEQEPVLDKVRAEFISLYPKNYAGEPELGGLSCVFSLNKVLNVIDKYKAESEKS